MTAVVELARRRHLTLDETRNLLSDIVTPSGNNVYTLVAGPDSSVSNNTLTKITWNSASSTESGAWASTPNPERVTIMRTGVYFVWMRTRFATVSVSDTFCLMNFYYNGSHWHRRKNSNNHYHYWTTAAWGWLEKGDYLEFYVRHNAGSARNVAPAAVVARFAL